VIETWFRAIYEALLRYSPRRLEVLRGIQFNAADLIDEDGDAMPFERAIARRMPFQNAGKAFAAFKNLDPKLDLCAPLLHPYKKRKASLYSCLDRFLRRRHSMIHGAEIDERYTTKLLIRDIGDMEASVFRMYDTILDRYGWSKDYDF
jgi:hypothetical protein